MTREDLVVGAGRVAEMLKFTPEDGTWAERVGPVYGVAAVARRWRVTADHVFAAIAERRIVGLLHSDSAEPLLPVEQFGPPGEPAPQLPDVLDALDPGHLHDPGSILWLATFLLESLSRCPDRWGDLLSAVCIRI